MKSENASHELKSLIGHGHHRDGKYHYVISPREMKQRPLFFSIVGTSGAVYKITINADWKMVILISRAK